MTEIQGSRFEALVGGNLFYPLGTMVVAADNAWQRAEVMFATVLGDIVPEALARIEIIARMAKVFEDYRRADLEDRHPDFDKLMRS